MVNETYILNAVTVVDEPFRFPCVEKLNIDRNLCPNPGADAEFFLILFEGTLRFPIRFHLAESYSVARQHLINGSADFEAYGVQIGQSGGLSPSPVIAYDDWSFFGKEISVEQRHSGWYVNFKGTVGLLKVMNWKTLLTVAAATVLTYVSKRSIVEKSQNFHISQKMDKVVQVFWFLVVNIFLSLFSNLMVIDLVQPMPPRSLPFKNYDELAQMIATGRCEAASLYTPNLIFLIINGSSSRDVPSLKSLQQSFNTHPSLYLPSREALADYIMRSNSRKCYVGFDFKSVRSYYEKKDCQLKMLESSVVLYQMSFVFYHNLPWLSEQLSSVLAADSVRALMKFISEKYLSPPKQKRSCNVSSEGQIHWVPLPLSKIFGTFVVVLFGGVVFTLLVLFLEKVHFSWIRPLRTNSQNRKK